MRPITHEIFNEPVLTCDGQTYEKNAIIKWLDTHNTSPLTNKKLINKTLVTNIKMKEHVNKILDKHIDKQIDTIISSKSNDIIKLTDNINDRGELIRYICMFANKTTIFDTVNIYIKNYLNIECPNDYGWSPIHYICRYSSPYVINFILNVYEKHNFNLECKSKFGQQPIHIICRYGTEQLIKKIINMYVGKDLNIDCADNSDHTPIHYICKYGTCGAIKFILDIYNNKNLNIVHVAHGKVPINHILERSDFENTDHMLDIYEKKSLDISHGECIESVLEGACKNMPMYIINRILNNYNAKK
jgi:ankyrin repeat protein